MISTSGSTNPGKSDEQVCAQWAENPYFQAFCGETYFSPTTPCTGPRSECVGKGKARTRWEFGHTLVPCFRVGCF